MNLNMFIRLTLGMMHGFKGGVMEIPDAIPDQPGKIQSGQWPGFNWDGRPVPQSPKRSG